MKRVAVFCGSSLGTETDYSKAAVELGGLLAAKKIGLVYGGGNIGLMGRVATATLEAGGHVTGVIPKFLMAHEIGKIDLPDLKIVDSMHERKALMAELSDGFIAMPGGFGTLEEFSETLTWGQLGLHTKPFGLLNVAGFYDHFLAFLDHAVERQLIKSKHRQLLLTDARPGKLLDMMENWRPVSIPKLMTPART